MNESYLTQSDKLELAAILGGGNEYEQDEQEDEYEGGEYIAPARAALSPAEYARQRCAFHASDAVRNGLHPAHVSASRKSHPVGWSW